MSEQIKLTCNISAMFTNPELDQQMSEQTKLTPVSCSLIMNGICTVLSCYVMLHMICYK